MTEPTLPPDVQAATRQHLMFPEYQPVVSAAMTWRATGQGHFTYHDWVTCAELALHIVEDANNRWAQQAQP